MNLPWFRVSVVLVPCTLASPTCWCPEHVEGNKILRKQFFPQFPQWKTLLLFSAGFSTRWALQHMQCTWSRSHSPQAEFCLDQEQLDLSQILVQTGISLLAHSISSNAKLSSLSRASASDICLRNFWIWETVFQNIQLLKKLCKVWKKKERVTTEMNEPDEKQNSVEEVTGLPDCIAQQ